MDSVVVVLIFILLWVLIRALGGGQRRQPQTLVRLRGPNAKPDSPVCAPQAAAVAGVTRKTENAPEGSPGAWIPPGSHVDIHGYKIAGGMIYVGSHLRQVSGHGIEPALIDPNLPVTEPPTGYIGEGIPYWPSYSTVSPMARGLYLKWLAGGRQDRNVKIGIVFLFFYGLERRLLAETDTLTGAESNLLIEEVERLRKVYGQNGSFGSYAGDLCGLLEVPLRERSLGNDPVTELDDEKNWGRNLRFIIGKMAAVGEPLPAKWALKWLMKSDFLYYPPPTPAQRCRDEFSRLFHIRYQQRFGAGLHLQVDTRELRLGYRPASASFSGICITRTAKVPDVRPNTQLRELAAACSNELDKYSRFLGRNPDRRLAPEALTLLPTELLCEPKDERLSRLIAWLTQTLDGKEIATIEFTELEAQWWEIHQHYGKQDAISLAECLEKLGFGIEPDIRGFGSYAQFLDGKLVLFKLIAGAPNNPSPQMNTALLTLRLGAMVLKSEGVTGAENEDHLVRNLCSALHLTAPERQRLRARLHWLLVSKSGALCNKKLIDKLNLGQKTTIGRFLVGATGAHVSPAGVKALEKVYRLLGLESETLYSGLQCASTSPVTVHSPDSGRGGYAIPPPPKPDGHEGGQTEIDMTKVSAMRAETEQVSELLRNIFVEDDERPTEGDILPPSQGSILGLSPAQSAFLRILVSKPSWTRAELEPLASAHQVLLNGAIDAINEKTLDNFGEPLLEGEERIEVNSAALKGLEL